MVYALIALVVLLDQVTKLLITNLFAPNKTFPIITDVLHLTYHTNTGAAWGILQDARWVFLVFSTLAILAILAYLIFKKQKPRGFGISLALICGGGIGNMVDRVRLGYVVDFVDFRLIDFPLFNLADSCVCIGTALFVFWFISSEIAAKKSKTDTTDV